MKRITVIRQTEDYYMVPDATEINEQMFNDFSPCVSMLKAVQVLNIVQFEDDIKTEQIGTNIKEDKKDESIENI
jgi:hypothetical protein